MSSSRWLSLQPAVVDGWCTVCLLSALITVGMIPFTFDEVLTSVQFIWKKNKQGHRLWHTFWFGGTIEGGESVEYDKAGNEQIKDLMKSLWRDLKLRLWSFLISPAAGLSALLLSFHHTSMQKRSESHEQSG